MLASGEAIFSLQAPLAARAFIAGTCLRVHRRGHAALRCVISSASQRRSCLRAVNRTPAMLVSRFEKHHPLHNVVAHRQAFQRQRKVAHAGAAACVSSRKGRRVHSPAFSRLVETATRRTSPTRRKRVARGNKPLASNRFCLSVVAKLGIDCDQTANGPAIPPTTAQRAVHRCGARRRNRSTQSPLLPRQRGDHGQER